MFFTIEPYERWGGVRVGGRVVRMKCPAAAARLTQGVVGLREKRRTRYTTAMLSAYNDKMWGGFKQALQRAETTQALDSSWKAMRQVELAALHTSWEGKKVMDCYTRACLTI